MPAVAHQPDRAGEGASVLRSPAVFVWGVWGLMVLGALALIVRYAHDVPYYDGWSMVEVLAGRSVDADWLWQPRNEHRVPIPKLVLLGLYAMSGWDFRSGMVFNVLLLAGVSWAMIRVAASRRGGLSPADAFFPIVLLHWGHYENLLWSWQVTQVVPVALVTLLLAVIVRWKLGPPMRVAVASAIAVALLPLCGIAGLVYVPGFALWLGAVGWHHWGTAGERGRAHATLLWCLTLVPLAIVPLYFVGLQSRARPSFAPEIVLPTILRFLAQGFGPAGVVFQQVLVVVVATLVMATFAMLLVALRRGDSGIRSSAWALLLFVVAFSGMAMSIGVGRAGTEELPNRYCLFAVPALCWIYLAWDRLSGAAWAHAVRVGLFLLVVALSSLNMERGKAYAFRRHTALSALEADLRRGAPPSQIIASHQRTVFPFPEDGGAHFHDGLGEWLAALQRAHVGAFGSLAPARAYRAVPIEAVASPRENEAGEEPGVTWTLPRARFVHGIRIVRPTTESSIGADPTSVYWRPEDEPFTRRRRGVTWWEDVDTAATFWICQPVYELGLPDRVGTSPAARPRIQLLAPQDAPAMGSVTSDSASAAPAAESCS